jgi:nucleoside-diphosphate-sugar epimerase
VHVLVTGAFGYVGLAILRGLEGHAVVGCGRPPRSAAAVARIPTRVETVYGDVLVEVPRLLGGGARFDAIIHLSGGGGPKKVESDTVAAVRDNVEAALVVVRAARRASVQRLLYASTIAVYGTHRRTSAAYRESDEARPDDFYGALKHAAERLCTDPDFGSGTALRLANVYGAGAGVDMGLSGAAERFARAAASGGEITVFGTGEQRMDYVHIDDVVRAFRLALEAHGPPPVVNIGGGQPASIASLAALCEGIGARFGTRPTIVRRPDPGGKIWPDRSLDVERASSVLGWRPQVSLEDGLAGLVDMMSRSASREVKT